MTDVVPPFLHAVLAEATRLRPTRRTSSDGTLGDPAHAAQGVASDHNPGVRGLVHAVDVSQSMPGSPYWDARYGQFDAHAYGDIIARRIIDGTEHRVKYLVSHNYVTGKAKIFNPSIGLLYWRDQDGDNHASHLHTSIVSEVSAEQSTAPYFIASSVPAPPPSPGGTGKMIVIQHPHTLGAYWCVDVEGHIYAYGGAHGFKGTGTDADPHFNGPITSGTATPSGDGIILATAAKSLYGFGDAQLHGDPH